MQVTQNVNANLNNYAISKTSKQVSDLSKMAASGKKEEDAVAKAKALLIGSNLSAVEFDRNNFTNAVNLSNNSSGSLDSVLTNLKQIQGALANALRDTSYSAVNKGVVTQLQEQINLIAANTKYANTNSLAATEDKVFYSAANLQEVATMQDKSFFTSAIGLRGKPVTANKTAFTLARNQESTVAVTGDTYMQQVELNQDSALNAIERKLNQVYLLQDAKVDVNYMSGDHDFSLAENIKAYQIPKLQDLQFKLPVAGNFEVALHFTKDNSPHTRVLGNLQNHTQQAVSFAAYKDDLAKLINHSVIGAGNDLFLQETSNLRDFNKITVNGKTLIDFNQEQAFSVTATKDTKLDTAAITIDSVSGQSNDFVAPVNISELHLRIIGTATDKQNFAEDFILADNLTVTQAVAANNKVNQHTVINKILEDAKLTDAGFYQNDTNIAANKEIKGQDKFYHSYRAELLGYTDTSGVVHKAASEKIELFNWDLVNNSTLAYKPIHKVPAVDVLGREENANFLVDMGGLYLDATLNNLLIEQKINSTNTVAYQTSLQDNFELVKSVADIYQDPNMAALREDVKVVQAAVEQAINQVSELSFFASRANLLLDETAATKDFLQKQELTANTIDHAAVIADMSQGRSQVSLNHDLLAKAMFSSKQLHDIFLRLLD